MTRPKKVSPPIDVTYGMSMPSLWRNLLLIDNSADETPPHAASQSPLAITTISLITESDRKTATIV
jgi:hypothetical protein